MVQNIEDVLGTVKQGLDYLKGEGLGSLSLTAAETYFNNALRFQEGSGPRAIHAHDAFKSLVCAYAGAISFRVAGVPASDLEMLVSILQGLSDYERKLALDLAVQVASVG